MSAAHEHVAWLGRGTECPPFRPTGMPAAQWLGVQPQSCSRACAVPRCAHVCACVAWWPLRHMPVRAGVFAQQLDGCDNADDRRMMQGVRHPVAALWCRPPGLSVLRPLPSARRQPELRVPSSQEAPRQQQESSPRNTWRCSRATGTVQAAPSSPPQLRCPPWLCIDGSCTGTGRGWAPPAEADRLCLGWLSESEGACCAAAALAAAAGTS